MWSASPTITEKYRNFSMHSTKCGGAMIGRWMCVCVCVWMTADTQPRTCSKEWHLNDYTNGSVLVHSVGSLCYEYYAHLLSLLFLFLWRTNSVIISNTYCYCGDGCSDGARALRVGVIISTALVQVLPFLQYGPNPVPATPALHINALDGIIISWKLKSFQLSLSFEYGELLRFSQLPHQIHFGDDNSFAVMNTTWNCFRLKCAHKTQHRTPHTATSSSRFYVSWWNKSHIHRPHICIGMPCLSHG